MQLNTVVRRIMITKKMVELNIKNPLKDRVNENDYFQELLQATENEIQKFRTTW